MTLTRPLAKRLNLPTVTEHLINAFLLKPREYYAYIHGTPPRHKAYTLCLAVFRVSSVIKAQTRDVHLGLIFYKAHSQYLARVIRDVWVMGGQFHCYFKTIAQQARVHEELRIVFQDVRVFGCTVFKCILNNKVTNRVFYRDRTIPLRWWYFFQ